MLRVGIKLEIELEGGAEHTDIREATAVNQSAMEVRANLVNSGLNQMIVL